MSSGLSLSETSVFWKSPDIKTIYRAAHKVTGPFAKSLVRQSGVISAASSARGERLKLLDQACGTGVIAEAFHQEFASAHANGVLPNWLLKCTDISPPMLQSIEELIAKNKWENVEVANSNILDNGLDANTFDYVFTSFVFMALPDSSAALDETLRVVKPGGTIAINDWKSVGWIDDFNKAAASISDEIPQVSYPKFSSTLSQGKWEEEAWIESLLQSKKLENIHVNVVPKTLKSGTPAEWIQGCLFPVQWITKSMWTEEQREKYKDKLLHTMFENSLQEAGSQDTEMTRSWEAIVITAQKPL